MHEEEAELREIVLPSAHPLTILLVLQGRHLPQGKVVIFISIMLGMLVEWHFNYSPLAPDCRGHLSLTELTFNPVQETQYHILVWWLNVPDGYTWPRHCRVMNSMKPIFLLEKTLRFKLLEDVHRSWVFRQTFMGSYLQASFPQLA